MIPLLSCRKKKEKVEDIRYAKLKGDEYIWLDPNTIIKKQTLQKAFKKEKLIINKISHDIMDKHFFKI
jgi:hypothetical protein